MDSLILLTRSFTQAKLLISQVISYTSYYLLQGLVINQIFLKALLKMLIFHRVNSIGLQIKPTHDLINLSFQTNTFYLFLLTSLYMRILIISCYQGGIFILIRYVDIIFNYLALAHPISKF